MLLVIVRDDEKFQRTLFSETLRWPSGIFFGTKMNSTWISEDVGGESR